MRNVSVGLKEKWALEFCGLMQLEITEKNLALAYMTIEASLEYGMEGQSEMGLLLKYAEASLAVDESFAVGRSQCKNGADYESWQTHHRRLRMVKWWIGVLLATKQAQSDYVPHNKVLVDDDGDYEGPLQRLQELLGLRDERIADG